MSSNIAGRGGTIGHGLWALPGGFVDPWDRFYPAAVTRRGSVRFV